MNEVITLRGLVLSKYRSINEFSKEIGWNRNKAMRILDGIQEPNIDDIKRLTSILNLSLELFLQIFFGGDFARYMKNKIS